MTEAEWSECENPSLMLLHMKAAASDRKMRLFVCACIRRVWHLVNDERLERVLLGIENFADGLISANELEPLHNLAWEIDEDDHAPSRSSHIAYELGILSRVERPGNPYSGPAYIRGGQSSAALAASGTGDDEEFQRGKKAERKQQTPLARDIFGNPFRPVAFSPSWRTSTAATLASQMYESRDFGAMPILADAIQDAGCDNADVLDHCREPAVHVRGCWVVDLVLGKE